MFLIAMIDIYDFQEKYEKLQAMDQALFYSLINNC